MKIFKKTLAMLLSIIMVFGIMPASVFMASAEEASACPIEGATGTGTEADPIIVDTFAELKAALTYSDELYVQVDTDINCTESTRVKGSKTLTVNGALYGSKTLFVCYNGGRVNFVLKGTGTLRTENNYAVEIQNDNKVTICENLTLISENLTPVTCSGSWKQDQRLHFRLC